MKVKYINNCTDVLFKTYGIMSDLSEILVLGGFGRYNLLREELLVLLHRTIFLWVSVFYWNKKHFYLVQIICITYEIRRKMLK